jgi:integrase
MNSSSQAYVGTAKRTFGQAIVHLLESQYSLLGSRGVLALIAQDVTNLAEQFFPKQQYLRPGWMVFTGVKATGHKAYPGQSGADHELVTLHWPVVTDDDLQASSAVPPGQAGREARRTLLRTRITRIVEYGWQHPEGPVLLTLADLGVMLGLTTVQVSQLLKEARKATGKTLLTKGYYFDQGMRPTHKGPIIALYEAGHDEADIARQTGHESKSVGHYIRDYERVKLLLKTRTTADRIIYLTGLQPNVVRAYTGMVYQYHSDLMSDQDVSSAQT